MGICLETLEHIDPSRVEVYVEALSDKLTGPLFITVPNEKGAALLAKTLAAKVLRGDRDQRYRPIEFVNAVLGRMDRVSRLEAKGFDHARLAGLLRRHFREVEVEGVGLGPLRVAMQLTVGMVARGGRGRT